MTDILSDSFYGNKILKLSHYRQLCHSIKIDLLKELFSSWLSNLASDNSDLQEILLDFLILNIKQALKLSFQFQKFTSFIQLSVRVFEDSFSENLNRKQSFNLFQEVVVRHSLFRPPYSVKVFETEDVRELSRFWIETFDRHFELYQNCFGKQVDRQIVSFEHPKALEEKVLGKPQGIPEDILSKLNLK